MGSEAGPSAPVPERTRLIVGIGASAGSIDAFKIFFSKMPADTGIAFVIVQHLDPDFESILPAIIANYTKMPVHAAKDGAAVSPNTVHVIPPNAILTIKGGLLRLARPAPPLPAANRSTPSWRRWRRTRGRTPSASSCPGSAATGRWASRPSRSTAA